MATECTRPNASFSVGGLSTVLALVSLGCGGPSDEATPDSNPAKASAHYATEDPHDVSLGSCNQIVQAAIAPDWQRTAELPLRESDLVPQDFGTLVPNGTTNEISCGVTPGPNGFSVSASLAGDNVSPTAGPASGQTRLQIAEGFIGLDGNGTAQVTVYTALSGSVKSKAACWLKAQPDPQLTGQFAVQPGEARFMFVCDVAASNLDDFATCSTRGAVWLKDCTQ